MQVLDSPLCSLCNAEDETIIQGCGHAALEGQA